VATVRRHDPLRANDRRQRRLARRSRHPLEAITNKDNAIPKLLRFNFTQHVHATGKAAAGPVRSISGADDSFMGYFTCGDANVPGMAGPCAKSPHTSTADDNFARAARPALAAFYLADDSRLIHPRPNAAAFAGRAVFYSRPGHDLGR
jgi:hypothetical protein